MGSGMALGFRVWGLRGLGFRVRGPFSYYSAFIRRLPNKKEKKVLLGVPIG